MILEIADIRVTAGREADFEKAVLVGLSTVFPRAKGFRGHEVRRSIESPERYVLLLAWDTLEDHTVGFRGSPLFVEWRGLVSEFFAQAPFVEHFNVVGGSDLMVHTSH